jgi:hypothetical protein
MTLTPRPAEKDGRTLDPGPRLEPRAMTEDERYWLKSAVAEFKNPQAMYDAMHGYWVVLARAGHQPNYSHCHTESMINVIKNEVRLATQT